MESEKTNQVSVPRSIMRKVKVYAAQNDLNLKDVVNASLVFYINHIKPVKVKVDE